MAERVRITIKRQEIVHRTVRCAFCKHWYINPCTEQTAPVCQNYQHLNAKPVRVRIPKTKPRNR